MFVYAIKIDNKYFKEYIYATKENISRYAGHTAFGWAIQDGDVIDIECTDTPQRTDTRRSLGNTISLLYTVDKLKSKTIEILPIEC